MKHEEKQYISVDGMTAAIGGQKGFVYFDVGETVAHQDEDAGTAVIERFNTDEESGDVKVFTDKGVASLPFLEKINK